MPRQSRGKRGGKQADKLVRLERQRHKIELAIRREKDAQRRKADKIAKKKYYTAKRISVTRAKSRTATAKQIKELNKLIDLGLYKPKKKRKRITKAQVWYGNKVKRKFRDLFKSDVVVVKQKARKASARKKIAAKFRKAGVMANERAIFVSNVPHATKAKLTRDAEGRPSVTVTRKIKHSKRGRTRETLHVTAVTADELLIDKAAIKKQFDRLAKKAKAERKFIRFYVEGKFGSFRAFSHNDFESMYAQFVQYWPKPAQLHHGITHVRLGIVQPGADRSPWVRKNRARTVDKTGRSGPYRRKR